jgi:transcriptional regulator with XRE-family HTH domain
MVISDRLRTVSEDRHLSQGDIEKRTGLLRCSISRIENGHRVPAIDTLEKLAHAMEVPLYENFYEGENPPKPLNLPKNKGAEETAVGKFGERRTHARKLPQAALRLKEGERGLLLHGPENGPTATDTRMKA